MNLPVLKKKLEEAIAYRNLCKKKGIEHQKKLKIQKKKQKDIELAMSFLQLLAKETQQNIEKKLSKIVTSALQTVYPEENYEFKIKFIEKRNSTECQLLFAKDGDEFSPLEESGGGPIDIAALALLVSFIKLEKKRPLIITDEPFKNVSKQKLPIAVQLLKNICEKLDFQIIMVTHFDEIIKFSDKSFKIVKGETHG